MATRVESSIETSIWRPSPVRARWNSAAETANAAVSPPKVSLTGNPTRKGPVSASPVTLITPERPWTIWS